MEVYLAADDIERGRAEVIAILAEITGVAETTLTEHAYLIDGVTAARHLFPRLSHFS